MSDFQVRGRSCGIATSCCIGAHQKNAVLNSKKSNAIRLGLWERLKNWVKGINMNEACECAWKLHNTSEKLDLNELDELIDNMFRLASYGTLSEDMSRIHINCELSENKLSVTYSFDGVIAQKTVEIKLDSEEIQRILSLPLNATSEFICKPSKMCDLEAVISETKLTCSDNKWFFEHKNLNAIQESRRMGPLSECSQENISKIAKNANKEVYEWLKFGSNVYDQASRPSITSNKWLHEVDYSPLSTSSPAQDVHQMCIKLNSELTKFCTSLRKAKLAELISHSKHIQPEYSTTHPTAIA